MPDHGTREKRAKNQKLSPCQGGYVPSDCLYLNEIVLTILRKLSINIPCLIERLRGTQMNAFPYCMTNLLTPLQTKLQSILFLFEHLLPKLPYQGISQVIPNTNVLLMTKMKSWNIMSFTSSFSISAHNLRTGITCIGFQNFIKINTEKCILPDPHVAPRRGCQFPHKDNVHS